MDTTEYTVTPREEATDFMASYPGFGEMRSYTEALRTDQVAFSWRQMPAGTGGRGSYGHRHAGQEEIYFVCSGTVTFKIGDDVFEAGAETAVRIAPEAWRSIHNDSEAIAELVLCSIRVDDLGAITETQEDFWPD